MHTSLHQDNPYLFDRDGKPTSMGVDYLETLQGLTGIRRDRYLHGKWVAAEGLVYDGWDESIHVIDRSRVPEGCWDLHSVDWGFQNALVWQVWAVDHDNRMYLRHEVSRKHWLVEDFARHVREWCDVHGWPQAIVTDHDAEDRATFERHARMPTIAARKAVGPGVQAVQNRLRKDATGRPGLFVVRDALTGRDPVAEARRTPRGVLAEITGYVWSTERGVDGIPREAPLKANDHSMDAKRYAVMHLDGAAPARAGNPASVGVVQPGQNSLWSRPVGR
jgi:phage terminase large subunit